MVGQGPDLAPADGRLYALRDVTSTVEFEPFIVSSIVSKKVAEGAMGLVFDVKCGSGAFMKNIDDAKHLAERLVRTTKSLGREASALITDMSQPLGRAVGNALEVRESIDVLKGSGPADVHELTLRLAAEMLRLSGAEKDEVTARERVEKALESGAAWNKWVELVAAHGGDVATMEDPSKLPTAPVVVPVKAARSGIVTAIDTFALGDLVVDIGGGRRAKEDDIDPRVGMMVHVRIGDQVDAGREIAALHLAAEDAGAVERAAAAFSIGEAAESRSLVLDAVS